MFKHAEVTQIPPTPGDNLKTMLTFKERNENERPIFLKTR
jgi:hypothetical protein